MKAIGGKQKDYPPPVMQPSLYIPKEGEATYYLLQMSEGPYRVYKFPYEAEYAISVSINKPSYGIRRVKQKYVRGNELYKVNKKQVYPWTDGKLISIAITITKEIFDKYYNTALEKLR